MHPARVEVGRLAARDVHRRAVVDEQALGIGRREAHDRARLRVGRVDGQMDEADDRPCAGDPARERLLRVPHAVGVRVRGLDDRQVAVGERRERRARETRAVPLATRAADEDREARPVDASRDDLAPVGDVQRERRRRVDVGRVREREVVDAAARQRAPAALRRVHEAVRASFVAASYVGPPRAASSCSPQTSRAAARRGADAARVRQRRARRAAGSRPARVRESHRSRQIARAAPTRRPRRTPALRESTIAGSRRRAEAMRRRRGTASRSGRRGTAGPGRASRPPR